MTSYKRKAEGDAPTNIAPAKVAKLEEDRVAKLPVGANVVEFDGKACTHEVAWPPGEEGSPLPPPKRDGPPAREYPFKIDPFQQTAVNCLEAGHSVLVAAHTSAGKTVVAEYAFAMALRDGTRVVYTSPLKALSNQKYRELAEQFGDVGLMTGDVTINPTASCLVMTTEILRSMLYKGSEVVREVQLLVYDEIHYLRDKERGVVWEETIMMAPRAARFAFLSATIPNAREFAEWVAQVHGSPCHVVYTDYRPTPLQHYIFPQGGDGLYMVVDERGVFKEDNFQAAVAALTGTGVDGKGTGAGGKGRNSSIEIAAGGGAAGGSKSDIQRIVRMIMERNYDPVIVFSFSKRECETLAAQMSSLELTDAAEKKLVDGIFWAAMDCLGPEDRKLPQINSILPMLKRGIGVHHSGLLPIVKEVIELLFQEGLIKVLFATETFSTGLNMPAKTVVFTHVKKFDGSAFRWVTSGEYIQMSGRAGRRGLDDRGIVILMLDTQLEPPVAKQMIKGAPDVMYSEFHLRYSMMINMARMQASHLHGSDGEDGAVALLKRSFRQFQLQRASPQLQQRVQQLTEERDAVQVPQQDLVEEYMAALQQLAAAQRQQRAAITQPDVMLPFLQPGRLVRLLNRPPAAAGEASEPQLPQFGGSETTAASSSSSSLSPVEMLSDGAWGAVVAFERVGKKREDEDAAAGSSSGQQQYIVDVLVNCDPATVPSGSSAGTKQQKPPRLLAPGQAGGTPLVVTFSLTQVDAISSVRIFLPADLRGSDARQQGIKVLAEALTRLQAKLGRVPLLDAEKEMRCDGKAARKLVSRLEAAEEAVSRHPLAAAADLTQRLAALQRRQALDQAVRLAKREAKAAEALLLGDELRCRQRVLRRLGHVDDGGVVTLKGRVAAEVSTGDELVLAELVLGGALGGWSAEQLVAAASCFVWQEKGDGGAKLAEALQEPLAAVRSAARRVGKVAAECKLAVNVDEYVQSFRPELMEVSAAWARGSRFADIMKLCPDLYEGSIVRAIRRLEELLRQLAGACRGVGDVDLAARLDDAIQRIRRDIVFAASLYL